MRLFSRVALPSAGLPALAILLKAAAIDMVGPGFVLGLGSLIVQLATWWGMALSIPWVAISCQVDLTKKQAPILATLVCAPLWFAGLLFVVPEEPAAVFLTSRVLLFLAAGYGVWLLFLATQPLALANPGRLPFVAGVSVNYLLIYPAVYLLIGLVANLTIILMGI